MPNPLLPDALLDSSNLRPAAIAGSSRCPLCEAQGALLRTFAKFETESTRLWKCSGCGTCYLDPQPSDRWLALEYKDYYARRANGMGVGKDDHFRAFFETHPVSQFSRALEIGGGEGACARAFLRAAPNSKLTVIESNAECEAFYRAIGTQVDLKTMSLEDWARAASASPSKTKVDLILCFDVLEHLRAPGAMLRILASTHLEPSGQFWATFPNADAFSRKALGALWPQYKTEHLFYFSESAVRQMCFEAGLDILELKPARKYLSIAYLLGVARNFGPQLTRPVFSILSRILPRWVQNQKINFSLGEWLLIAKKKENPA